MKRRLVLCLAAAGCLAWACGIDGSLREYLSTQFWYPFAKRGTDLATKHSARLAIFAGMAKSQDGSALQRLRDAYSRISVPSDHADVGAFPQLLAAARAESTLTPQDRDEVDLIDAKVDIRAGSADPEDENLNRAKVKLKRFLDSARTPAFRSEARGWLAYVLHLQGDQAGAGKIYLDELGRSDSSLSREVLVNSLRVNYGYDGGSALIDQLDQYFDTPEHAVFAIQLVTNPRSGDAPPIPYDRLKALLDRHAGLLRTNKGADLLALLAMRVALRAGDPKAAARIASGVPANAPVRSDPDFLWMLASSRFLAHQFASAESPLLKLFRSRRATIDQKAAAAYGLCGVYHKTSKPVEGIRFGLWLATESSKRQLWAPSEIEDGSIYWAISGWDLKLLLEFEASSQDLRDYLEKYPNEPNARLVRYSLAVRLARANKYDDSAAVYEQIGESKRAARMRALAPLYREANRTDLDPAHIQQARLKLARFIGENPDRLYFNAALWNGFQRYALQSGDDKRLTRAERERLMAAERRLKDEQEERWRAYQILRAVVKDAPGTPEAREAAALALDLLVRISERFDRKPEIEAAMAEMRRSLRRRSAA